MKLFKTLIAVGLLVAGLAFAAPAKADFQGAQSSTIGDWASGAVTIGDKTFTLLDTTLSSGLQVNFTAVGNEYGVGVQFGAGQFGPFSAVLHYSVQINDPSRYFVGVKLDTTHAGTGVQVVKSETNGKFGSLISTNGTPSSNTIAGAPTTLDVTDSISILSGGVLTSMTNGYIQGQNGTVPEPSSLAILLGLGGLGLVVRARRNAKKA